MTRKMCDELPPKIPKLSLRAVRSTCKLERRACKEKVGRGMEGTSICDLPADLIEEKILTRVPITSLRTVRSTCKLWDSLTKEWVLGKAAATREQFLGFMTKDLKVCSVRFHLRRNNNKYNEEEDEDLLDLSVKQVDLLDQFQISRIFHCDGLLLCVVKDHSRRLVMWNPYMGQTQLIGLTTDIHKDDCYALGYDIYRNHKILRFLNYGVRPELKRYEIYELSSNSWRVLKVTLPPIWEMLPYPGVVTLKGNTYFFSPKGRVLETHGDGSETIGYEYFLLCFDFTTERFGPPLPLPYNEDDHVTLSCVREEKLAVLYHGYTRGGCYEIWVTTTIEPNHVSWSQFLRVKMEPFSLTGMLDFTELDWCGGSFFIDEEEKIAVVFDFDFDRPLLKETGSFRDKHHHTAFVIGEDGYFKSVRLGVAHKDVFCTPFVCSSSYLPSLVQLNKPHKGKGKEGSV